jgi:putative membrane protein
MGAHVHPAGHDPAVAEWILPAALLAVLIGTYLALAARRRRTMARSWSPWRTASWVTGSVLLATAISPWVADLAHTDARGHMAQHLLLGMYAPLGLVLAAPVTLLLGASSPAARRRIATFLGSGPVRVLSHPLTAGVVNVGGLYALYLTGLYAASTRSPLLHLVVSMHFVAAGTLFSWAIAGPDPARHRPGIRARVLALVAVAAAHSFLAKTLYARADELPPGSPHPPADMELAAQWMYYGGDLAELALAVALVLAASVPFAGAAARLGVARA